MLTLLKIKVILRSVLWKVLWGTQNGSSMASLQKKSFETFIFNSVELHLYILSVNAFPDISVAVVQKPAFYLPTTCSPV